MPKVENKPQTMASIYKPTMYRARNFRYKGRRTHVRSYGEVKNAPSVNTPSILVPGSAVRKRFEKE